MPTHNTWIITTQSRPLPGCEIDMDGCEFYFADVFLPVATGGGATALIEAINKVKEALLLDKLELADVLLCAHFKPEEWVDQSDSAESLHELANKASETNSLVFSGFRSEEIQQLYHYTHTLREIVQ
ncbi:MAG: hypothetical protein RL497_796 [Pseudomonadota bacterium]|jgi:hypothetical protein